jgi:hypothetical protein
MSGHSGRTIYKTNPTGDNLSPVDIVQKELIMTTDSESTIAIFERYKIRRHYDEENDVWYFSVIDILHVLLQNSDYQTTINYWKVLKNRLKKEGSQTVTNCNRLKMRAEDGKMRLTDVANPQILLRLIQSVPSPKAEPIKLWLAKVGYERMQDMADPAKSLDRAREYWQQHGRSEKWIQQRMTGQETRNKLIDYWNEHDIKEEEEYAILTSIDKLVKSHCVYDSGWEAVETYFLEKSDLVTFFVKNVCKTSLYFSQWQ